MAFAPRVLVNGVAVGAFTISAARAGVQGPDFGDVTGALIRPVDMTRFRPVHPCHFRIAYELAVQRDDVSHERAMAIIFMTFVDGANNAAVHHDILGAFTVTVQGGAGATLHDPMVAEILHQHGYIDAVNTQLGLDIVAGNRVVPTNAILAANTVGANIGWTTAILAALTPISIQLFLVFLSLARSCALTDDQINKAVDCIAADLGITIRRGELKLAKINDIAKAVRPQVLGNLDIIFARLSDYLSAHNMPIFGARFVYAASHGYAPLSVCEMVITMLRDLFPVDVLATMNLKGVRTPARNVAYQNLVNQAQAAYTQQHGNAIGFVPPLYILTFDEFLERFPQLGAYAILVGQARAFGKSLNPALINQNQINDLYNICIRIGRDALGLAGLNRIRTRPMSNARMVIVADAIVSDINVIIKQGQGAGVLSTAQDVAAALVAMQALNTHLTQLP